MKNNKHNKKNKHILNAENKFQKNINTQNGSNVLADYTVRIIWGCIITLILFVFIMVLKGEILLESDAAFLWLLLLVPAFIFCKKFMAGICEKGNIYLWLLAEVIVCLAVKLHWVMTVKIEPLVDYATFNSTAVSLAENGNVSSHYVALFPHIAGYSYFLGMIYRVFGCDVFVANVVNVILSLISMICMFYTSYKIIGRTAAITASLLWIICPSQTIYNMYVLSEPLYTALLLIVWSMILYIEVNHLAEKYKYFVRWTFFALCGLLLGLINGVRPVSIVVVISIFIYEFFIHSEYGKKFNRKDFCHKAGAFVLMTGIFLLVSGIWMGQVDVLLGEKAARTQGYTMTVGANESSMGQWNQEDSDILFAHDEETGQDAEATMKLMMDEFKSRVSNGINWPVHLWNKIRVFLGNDKAAVRYMYTIDDEKLIRDKLVQSDMFYYFILAVALVSGFKGFVRRDKTFLIYFALYVLGLTSAHMFAEVAGRYHYSVIPALIILLSCTMGKERG